MNGRPASTVLLLGSRLSWAGALILVGLITATCHAHSRVSHGHASYFGYLLFLDLDFIAVLVAVGCARRFRALLCFASTLAFVMLTYRIELDHFANVGHGANELEMVQGILLQAATVGLTFLGAILSPIFFVRDRGWPTETDRHVPTEDAPPSDHPPVVKTEKDRDAE